MDYISALQFMSSVGLVLSMVGCSVGCGERGLKILRPAERERERVTEDREGGGKCERRPTALTKSKTCSRSTPDSSRDNPMKLDLASVWGKKKSSQGCVGWRGPQRYTAFGLCVLFSSLVPVCLVQLFL